MRRRCARRSGIGQIKDLLRICSITLCLFLWIQFGCGDSATDSNSRSGNEQTELAAARARFHTKIVADTLAQSGPATLSPPAIFQTVRYNAPVGPCVAYLTPDPGDGKKHPAVLWAHGGYGGIDSYFWADQPVTNDQSARAFREEGLVLMIPSWRGENDNPGKFEMFYGEVDDLLAARNYLAGLPYVDPSRIYLAGHSTGGTLALLAAESGSGFRATFSLGGVADLKKRLAAGKTQTGPPFDMTKEQEFTLRSPIFHLGSLRSPTFYFEGEGEYTARQAVRMAIVARELNVPFQVFIISGGDHFSIILPITRLIASKVLADTGEACNIQVTPEEVQTAFKTLAHK